MQLQLMLCHVLCTSLSLPLSPTDIVIEVRDTVQNVYEGEAGNMLCLNVIGRREVDFTYFYSLSPDTAQGICAFLPL